MAQQTDKLNCVRSPHILSDLLAVSAAASLTYNLSYFQRSNFPPNEFCFCLHENAHFFTFADMWLPSRRHHRESKKFRFSSYLWARQFADLVRFIPYELAYDAYFPLDFVCTSRRNSIGEEIDIDVEHWNENGCSSFNRKQWKCISPPTAYHTYHTVPHHFISVHFSWFTPIVFYFHLILFINFFHFENFHLVFMGTMGHHITILTPIQ